MCMLVHAHAGVRSEPGLPGERGRGATPGRKRPKAACLELALPDRCLHRRQSGDDPLYGRLGLEKPPLWEC
eukprot:NODE_1545_length_1379_cov_7.848120_g155_i3.p9 GENE.NODE_1545_length_1379_cov_7.848120_g155_i3~~NODE_1545_length_1379_cov_7.848120_g155_i3.p9  ORF type:complete len:71 (-),score=1.17 NODE_1545_length_1379_cov_7.848120_g155_i3:903-1115(-)